MDLYRLVVKSSDQLVENRSNTPPIGEESIGHIGEKQVRDSFSFEKRLRSQRGNICVEYGALLALFVIAIHTPLSAVRDDVDHTFRSAFNTQQAMLLIDKGTDNERSSRGEEEGSRGDTSQEAGAGSGKDSGASGTSTTPEGERYAGGGSQSTHPTTESSEEAVEEVVDTGLTVHERVTPTFY